MSTKASSVLIIDFGSAATQTLARAARNMGVYSTILPCSTDEKSILAANPSAIILLGGKEGLGEKDSPPFPPILLDLNIPILAAGYPMRFMAQSFGAEFTSQTISSKASVQQDSIKDKDVSNIESEILFVPAELFWKDKESKKWTLPFSSQAPIKTLPDCLLPFALSGEIIVAFQHKEKEIYALEFPLDNCEKDFLQQLLTSFLFTIANIDANWDISLFVKQAIEQSKKKVGDANVVLGLSGGVDSTVVAALLHKALGKQLHCIFVDTGLMRLNEADEVISSFKQVMPDMNLYKVDAQQLFLEQLAGVDDPEKKRKIIGSLFIEVFEQEAKKISNVAFLAQGTVYPDIIESYSPTGKVLKSHHNVGGLPEKMKLQLIEPLKELFKDEVRAVGEYLQLPSALVWRHPFPGPGLAIRILGAVSSDRLDTLRQADAILIEELKRHNWYSQVWQAFAILLPLKTVGISSSGRSYDNVLALRMVNSIDAMSAQWARVPDSLLDLISQRILQEVKGINRVVYDISSKPPSTIEWE